jgi:hypothetical protein
MAVGLLVMLASGSDVSGCDKPGPAPIRVYKENKYAATTNPGGPGGLNGTAAVRGDEADDDGQRPAETPPGGGAGRVQEPR